MKDIGFIRFKKFVIELIENEYERNPWEYEDYILVDLLKESNTFFDIWDKEKEFSPKLWKCLATKLAFFIQEEYGLKIINNKNKKEV